MGGSSLDGRPFALLAGNTARYVNGAQLTVDSRAGLGTYASAMSTTHRTAASRQPDMPFRRQCKAQQTDGLGQGDEEDGTGLRSSISVQQRLGGFGRMGPPDSYEIALSDSTAPSTSLAGTPIRISSCAWGAQDVSGKELLGVCLGLVLNLVSEARISSSTCTTTISKLALLDSSIVRWRARALPRVPAIAIRTLRTCPGGSRREAPR